MKGYGRVCSDHSIRPDTRRGQLPPVASKTELTEKVLGQDWVPLVLVKPMSLAEK
jgi:hypothetical protein